MGYGYSSYAGAAIGGMVLLVIVLIAGLVLTIVACVKYLGKNGDRSSKLGRLFNFDHLFVETIMKVVYIMSVIGITLGCLWMVLTTAFVGNVGTFFISLFVGIIAFFVLQLLCRLSFEMTMAFVRMSSDVHAMRKTIVGDIPDAAPRPAGPSVFESIAARIPKQPVAPSSAAAPVPPATPVSSAPQQPVQQAPAAPAAEAQPAQQAPTASTSDSQPARASADATVVMPPQPDADSGAWTCPLCGRTGNTAKFCPKCGCERP